VNSKGCFSDYLNNLKILKILALVIYKDLKNFEIEKDVFC
jgi:hypothetical protein